MVRGKQELQHCLELWTLQCIMYPARRSCTPCWAVPTYVRNMFHISGMTDLHLMLLDHWKKGSWTFKIFWKSSHIHAYFLFVWKHAKKPHMLMLITYQRSEKWPWGPWIRLSSCTPLVDVNKNEPSGHKCKESSKCEAKKISGFVTAFVCKSFFFKRCTQLIEDL